MSRAKKFETNAWFHKQQKYKYEYKKKEHTRYVVLNTN